MSHVTQLSRDDVPIRDIDQLRKALELMNQHLGTKLELVKQKDYRTWKADHNEKLVGDYPVPKGWKAADVGHNAEYVIRIAGLSDAERGAYYGASRHGAPYEIGVVPSRTEEGRYDLMWDFYAGGYGIEKQVGSNCDRLFQGYQAAGVELEALNQGHLCVWTLNPLNEELLAEVTTPETMKVVG